jgi:hypothetical protein
MAYVWTEDISVNADIEDTNVDEIRTNINTERVDRAGLAAQVWTNPELEGDVQAWEEILELRTAIDAAYDELLVCAAHYTTNDGTHYTTDKTSHDSSDDATHYTTHEAVHYTTDDSNHDTTHYTTHYSTDDATDHGTHYAAANSSRKTFYDVGVK